MADLAGLRGRAAIVGVADEASPTGELDGSVRALEVRMIREALDDAGLSISDVDAVFSNGSSGWAPSLELAEYLGISPRWTDTTNTGGSSFEIHVEHAAAAIALGLCDVAVIPYAATPRSSFKRGQGGFRSRQAMGGPSPQAEWELPYGLRMPMGAYGRSTSLGMPARPVWVTTSSSGRPRVAAPSMRRASCPSRPIPAWPGGSRTSWR